MRGWVWAAVATVGLSSAAMAEELCPDVNKQPVQDGTRMSEETFEVPSGLDAADKLTEFLNKETLTYDFSQVINAFVTKGVILRQQALGTRVALELAKMRAPANPTSKVDVTAAEVSAKKALDTFCAFMVTAVVAE